MITTQLTDDTADDDNNIYPAMTVLYRRAKIIDDIDYAAEHPAVLDMQREKMR